MTQQYPPPFDPQQPPQWAPPFPGGAHAAPPPPKKKRRWPLYLLAGVVGLFLTVAVANSGDPQTPQPGVVPVTQPPHGGLQTETRTVPESAINPPKAATGPLTSFGPGTYEVGVDIVPGKYKTQGGGVGGSCYWARMKDTSGDLNGIIANGNTAGPATVTISKSDGAFQTTCDSWVKAG